MKSNTRSNVNLVLRVHRALPALVVPPEKKKPAIADLVVTAASQATKNSSNVYVHCYFQNEWADAFIRIWRSTVLVDRDSGEKAVLMHSENIANAPLWMQVPNHRTHHFLLVFTGLPKGCTSFDLVEEIPQAGGFCVKNIQRNGQDVYHVDV